mmetsp:Transcript_1331/g.4615  ORF Transcript_1331/g.4615 Transcript_1331/m.4615 type:complete len:227 (+) Transcript_1331:61-741(+)
MTNLAYSKLPSRDMFTTKAGPGFLSLTRVLRAVAAATAAFWAALGNGGADGSGLGCSRRDWDRASRSSFISILALRYRRTPIITTPSPMTFAAERGSPNISTEQRIVKASFTWPAMESVRAENSLTILYSMLTRPNASTDPTDTSISVTKMDSPEAKYGDSGSVTHGRSNIKESTNRKTDIWGITAYTSVIGSSMPKSSRDIANCDETHRKADATEAPMQSRMPCH